MLLTAYTWQSLHMLECRILNDFATLQKSSQVNCKMIYRKDRWAGMLRWAGQEGAVRTTRLPDGLWPSFLLPSKSLPRSESPGDREQWGCHLVQGKKKGKRYASNAGIRFFWPFKKHRLLSPPKTTIKTSFLTAGWVHVLIMQCLWNLSPLSSLGRATSPRCSTNTPLRWFPFSLLYLVFMRSMEDL